MVLGFCASTIPVFLTLRSANVIGEITFQGKHDLDTLGTMKDYENMHEALGISGYQTTVRSCETTHQNSPKGWNAE